MNQKIKYITLIPVFGTVILLFCLFIKSTKRKSEKKKFYAFFFSSGLVGFLSILFIAVMLNLINSIIDISNFLESYGVIISFIVGGYIMNVFTLYAIDKYYNKDN